MDARFCVNCGAQSGYPHRLGCVRVRYVGDVRDRCEACEAEGVHALGCPIRCEGARYRVRFERDEGGDRAIANTLQGAMGAARVLADAFGMRTLVFPCLGCRALVGVAVVEPRRWGEGME